MVSDGDFYSYFCKHPVFSLLLLLCVCVCVVMHAVLYLAVETSVCHLNHGVFSLVPKCCLLTAFLAFFFILFLLI